MKLDFTEYHSLIFLKLSQNHSFFFFFKKKKNDDDVSGQPGAPQEIETYLRGNSYAFYKSDQTKWTKKSDQPCICDIQLTIT